LNNNFFDLNEDKVGCCNYAIWVDISNTSTWNEGLIHLQNTPGVFHGHFWENKNQQP